MTDLAKDQSELEKQSVNQPKITVLGAGPAGVAAAFALSKDDKAEVQIIERATQVGGNSSSFLMAEGVGSIFH